MKSALGSLRDRLERVRERLRRSAEAAGRAPQAVRLVAVVKTVPVPMVAEVVALGVGDLGESRVQEAEQRIAGLGRGAARWHLVGHLQRNKVGKAVQLFDRIHSVDTLDLARALSARAGAAGLRPRILVEVNVSGEPSKHGVAPEGAAGLVEAIATLPALELDGLMMVGRRVASAEEARPGFARLRALRDAIEASSGLRLPELSMGMSDDFEAAIAEGSTMVRVGTALFGAAGPG